MCMAAPLKAALALSALIPPGPVLELCCGVGGLTRGLAAGHPVLAVDRSPSRLAQARANLRDAGRGTGVELVCCDLEFPALVPSGYWAACVLDPDWSPDGRPPNEWASGLDQMRPPALALARWAASFCPRLVLRLPPDVALDPLTALGPSRVWPVRKRGRVSFRFVLVGGWPAGGEALEL